MTSLKQKLTRLILGKRGGENRIQIIKLLIERPFNLNQMAVALDVNYRTIKYHINKLINNGIVRTAGIKKYGEIYQLTPEMEENISLFYELIKKFSDIRTSPHFFKDILEQTHDAVIILDEESRVLFLNESAEKLYGYSEDDTLGKELPMFPRKTFLKKRMKQMQKEKEIKPFDTQWKNKSGEFIDVNVHIDAIVENGDHILGFFILSRDITERKKIENAHIEAQIHAENLLENIPLPLLVLDSNIRVIYANRSYYQIFQVKPKDTLKKSLHELGEREWDIPELRSLLGEILQQRSSLDNYKVELGLPMIGKRTLLLNARSLLKKQNDTYQILLIIEDITERIHVDMSPSNPIDITDIEKLKKT